MTGLEDVTAIRDELRECCTRQLNTRLFQMNGATVLGACDKVRLLELTKAIVVKGVHKEVPWLHSRGCTSSKGRATRFM